MSADKPDDTRSHETDSAAMWSSDGVTRSIDPPATGLPTDLPFLFSPGQQFGPYRIVRPLGTGVSYYELLHGIVQHDGYHAGQIAVLKKVLLRSQLEIRHSSFDI
jgi:hypothetical protein